MFCRFHFPRAVLAQVIWNCQHPLYQISLKTSWQFLDCALSVGWNHSGPSSSCEMIILRNIGHAEKVRKYKVTRKHWRPVSGPPLRTGSADYPADHSKKRITIRNNDFTYGLSNRLLVSAKFRTLHCANVTDLGSGLGASYIITHYYFLCWRYTVHEGPGSLREASGKPGNLCSFPSAIWFRPLSHGFVNSIQVSQFIQRNYRYKQPEMT